MGSEGFGMGACLFVVGRKHVKSCGERGKGLGAGVGVGYELRVVVSLRVGGHNRV